MAAGMRREESRLFPFAIGGLFARRSALVFYLWRGPEVNEVWEREEKSGVFPPFNSALKGGPRGETSGNGSSNGSSLSRGERRLGSNT